MFAWGTTRYAVLLAAAALGLAGCGEGAARESDDGERTAATTERLEGPAETTAEAEPEPITPAEERWLRMLTRYNDRFEREQFRSGAVTHASMRRDARLFRDCRLTLRRAGDPGRLEPAAKRARRACDRLDRAAKLLDQAIAATDPGGAVTAGTPEEQIFDRSFGAAAEAAGNAHFGLQRAEEIGAGIKRKLDA